MLNKSQKIIWYIIIGIIILFAFAFLSQQLSLTYHLRQTLLHTNNANLNIENLKHITRLHQSSARVFLLAFFSFIIIITGFAIVNNGINKAYEIAEVKEKVRLHLKSTTTGMLMIVVGVLLLAFCSYKHANIETFYNSRLVRNDRKFFAVPQQPVQQNNQPVYIDSSLLPKAVNSLNKNIQKSKKISHQNSSIIAGKAKDNLKKLSSANKKISTNNFSHKTNKINEFVPLTLAKKSNSEVENNVNEKDVDWAKQLEKNTVIYGYVPVYNDQRKYEHVMQQKGNELNDDMHWAYTFLKDTKQGYQPTDNELRRYEKIIEKNILFAQQNMLSD